MNKRDGRGPTASRSGKHRERKKVSKRRTARRLTPPEVLRRVLAVLLPLVLQALSKQLPEKTVKDTCRFLIKAGACGGTLTSARRTSKKGKSRRQMWRVLASLGWGRLQRAITFTLRRQIQPWLPRESVDLAMDLHLIPYTGDSEKTTLLLKSQARQGTNRFHGYSTAYLAFDDRRLIIGCRWVWTKKHLVKVVEKHLRDAEALGIKVRRLLLDREFYDMEVLSFLIEKGIPFLMPPRVGKKMQEKWEHGSKSYVTTHTMRKEGKTLDLTIHVVTMYKKGRRGEKGVEYLPYVVGGAILPPKVTRELYRRRFGIETSYRITERARPRTNSHDPAIRFLMFAVAVLLENEWVIMKLAYASERNVGRKGFVVVQELLRFDQLLNMLLSAVRKLYGEVTVVSAEGPPPGFVEVILIGDSRG